MAAPPGMGPGGGSPCVEPMGKCWGSVRPRGHGCRAGEQKAPQPLPAMGPWWEECVHTDTETGTHHSRLSKVMAVSGKHGAEPAARGVSPGRCHAIPTVPTSAGPGQPPVLAP